MHKDLIDPELFGNEAGEDEPLEILSSYFVEKPEFEAFYSSKNRFQIVKARKGVGKSTLLRKTFSQHTKEKPESLLIYLKGSDLMAVQALADTSPHGLIYGWQQRICSRINVELGKMINLALSDAAISLVESAELAGFKNRNLVSTLFDRMKSKLIPVEKQPVSATNAQSLLQRYSENSNPEVWLFIDDIDATFVNNPEHRLLVSTFFSACRNLVTSVNGLYIRASVRTDIWPILCQHDEALDKCEQYLVDLSWSTAESGEILTRKILSFFQRKYPDDPKFAKLDAQKDEREILILVFTNNFRWGNRIVPPDRPIFILSAGRPRWATHLCKLAGKVSYKRHGDRISIVDIHNSLEKYGESRINDLYKEHRHQFPKLERLIECFARGRAKYTTHALLALITSKMIRQHGVPEIDGFKNTSGAMDIAHFLYRIGFIHARDDTSADKELSFIRYDERPNLLQTNVNPDDGLIWEIHPSYRQVLRIQ